MSIRFAWPDKELSPNARLHHMQLARAKAKYRAACAWDCKAQGIRTMDADSLHVALTFHPPTRRRFDLDNLLSRMKAGLDGLADVIGVDDSKWSISIKRGDPTPGGCVFVELSA